MLRRKSVSLAIRIIHALTVENARSVGYLEVSMRAVLSRRYVVTAAMLVSAYLGLSPAPSGAEGTNPIQSPITGNEDLGDLSQPQQALAQFYRAFNTRDLKMIDAQLPIGLDRLFWPDHHPLLSSTGFVGGKR